MALDLSNFKKPSNIDSGKSLPPGAYICKIVNAFIDEDNPVGAKLTLHVDIAKGEFAGYFSRIHLAFDDVWSYKATFSRYIFKNGEITKPYLDLIKYLEQSNPNFDYDETNLTAAQFIGMYCGFSFGEVELKSSQGFLYTVVKIKFPASIKAVKDGKVKIPELQKYQPPESTPEPTPEQIEAVPFDEEDLPF